jgi:hypothetical protein
MSRKLITTFTLTLAVFFVNTAFITAESRFVRLSIEVDRKRIQEKFQLLVYAGKNEVEPLRFENGFVVPEVLSKYEKVDIKILFRNYDLLFEDVPVEAFTLDWIIGVDLRPFDSENMSSTEKPPAGKRLSFIYYIHYVARTAKQADTKRIVRVFK